jgi:hypothetical protein
MAREAVIIVGRESGASNVTLTQVMGVASSIVSRRFDS